MGRCRGDKIPNMKQKSEKRLLVGVLSVAFALAARAESSTGNGLGGIPIPPAPSTSVGQIVVYEDATKGPVKPVNGVNGAPHKAGTPAFAAWKRLEIPYGRTHDFGLIPSYGGTRSVDIASIFRDFGADENDPVSYDFANTDMILRRLRDGGTEPFYRLGAEYEGWLAKKYTIYPPKDPAKWARICEHVIAHYNEGWANGHRWNIRHWEIWNEPDLGTAAGGGIFWGGTRDEFKTLFKTTLVHLKKRFPGLKFGGAAFSEPASAWAESMLKEFAAEKVPLDFYSWHQYATRPDAFASSARAVRAMLDRNGFGATESVFDEWNYVKGWDQWDQEYSFQVERGAFAQKGAAFLAASLVTLQAAPVDKAMLYDAATFALMNTLFHNPTGYPLPGYYACYAWAKLRRLGTEVRATNSVKDAVVVAARGEDGRIGLLLARYSEDNNVTRPERVTLRLASARSLADARCHLSDDFRLFTDVPLDINADGSADVELRPNSFALVEWGPSAKLLSK